MDKAKTHSSEKLREILNKSTWHERLLFRIGMYFYMIKHAIRAYFLSLPKNVDGANHSCEAIKDDIEFGYTPEMIYGKIIYGNYGNEARPKSDHFKSTRKMHSRTYFVDDEEFEVVLLSPKNSHKKIGDDLLKKIVNG
jgi:hypothetical protein